MTLLQAKSVEELIPGAPVWLRGYALEKWGSIWLILDRSRIKSDMHGDLVATYCQAYGDFRKAIEKLESMGEFIKVNEKILPNPYVSIRENAVSQMTSLGKLLGLQPDSPLMPKRCFEDYNSTDGVTHDFTGLPGDDAADEQRGDSNKAEADSAGKA